MMVLLLLFFLSLVFGWCFNVALKQWREYQKRVGLGKQSIPFGLKRTSGVS
jgi:hypothetical protein